MKYSPLYKTSVMFDLILWSGDILTWTRCMTVLFISGSHINSNILSIVTTLEHARQEIPSMWTLLHISVTQMCYIEVYKTSIHRCLLYGIIQSKYIIYWFHIWFIYWKPAARSNIRMIKRISFEVQSYYIRLIHKDMSSLVTLQFVSWKAPMTPVMTNLSHPWWCSISHRSSLYFSN